MCREYDSAECSKHCLMIQNWMLKLKCWMSLIVWQSYHVSRYQYIHCHVFKEPCKCLGQPYLLATLEETFFSMNRFVSQKHQDQVQVNPRILQGAVMQSQQQSGDLSLQILIIIRRSAQVWLDLSFTVNCFKTVAFLHIMPCNLGGVLSEPGVSLFKLYEWIWRRSSLEMFVPIYQTEWGH
jgi:hypothetical protein